MTDYRITERQIADFAQHLKNEERSAGTIEKYQRDVLALSIWLDGKTVTKAAMTGWKERLVSDGYRPATINSMLAAANAFCSFMGWEACRVKALRLQRQMFRDAGRELTRAEYGRLVNAARVRSRDRLALLMETMAATGIRVSEVRYITVETARRGRAEISLKGKIRTILLPSKLCRKLLQYARKQKIAFGEIFLTKSGKGLSRRQIWAEMKGLCKYAGVKTSKVFPHNLRHLFATAFYQACKDIVKLADVLGHSSIETTRIYLMTTGTEYVKQLDQLGLVS